MNIVSTQYTLQNKAFEIYIAGCTGTPKCSGCYNKELWDFQIGQEYNSEYYEKIKEKIDRFSKLITSVMVLGGEPLDQNMNEFLSFIEDMLSFKKSLWLFTRYELSEIPENIKIKFDYIKTGRYIKELITDTNVQYGIKLATSNQKIYKRGEDYQSL